MLMLMMLNETRWATQVLLGRDKEAADDKDLKAVDVVDVEGGLSLWWSHRLASMCPCTLGPQWDVLRSARPLCCCVVALVVFALFSLICSAGHNVFTWLAQEMKR